ncbi:hypothetical protein NE865_15426 [Phthorimaea operculella]|nr:hypothetical protein NE865_15426 [Phthorimaea operculella]
MRAFMVLACVALAYGRPEPPVGYSYSAPARHAAPSGSYGAPSSGGRVSLGGHSSGGLSLSSHSFGGGHSSGGLSLGGHSSGGSSFGGHSFGGHSSGGISLGSSGFGGDSGFGGGYAGGYSGAPLVQKHIYVHVPPPEPQEHKAPRIHQVAAPQKHYKIIFIKAPAPPAPTAPVIPVQPQNEEKTLVYVLVKKPEEQPDIVIPTPAPTQPSKPEEPAPVVTVELKSLPTSAPAAVMTAVLTVVTVVLALNTVLLDTWLALFTKQKSLEDS